MTQDLRKAIRSTCKELRKNCTPAEKVLWERIRNRKLYDLKFIRQYPFVFHFDNQNRFFVADFYCAEMHLIIELDGPIHENQKDYDVLRDSIITRKGIKVLRLKMKRL